MDVIIYFYQTGRWAFRIVTIKFSQSHTFISISFLYAVPGWTLLSILFTMRRINRMYQLSQLSGPPPPLPLAVSSVHCWLRTRWPDVTWDLSTASLLPLLVLSGWLACWVLTKYFYCPAEMGKFIENVKVKMGNKEKNLNCYLMMIYPRILEFCENNRKFLKALLLWHTSRTGQHKQKYYKPSCQ